MNIINLTNITKFYTERKLFEKASFYLQENEKVGIIGINGTGKSTLLKIIAGIEEPDDGSVIRANHVVPHYLPQNPEFDSDMTVIEAVLSQTKEAKAGNWNLESDAKSMMTRLGITDFSQKVGELSGGQRKRLALVAALVVPCDVLLLDEPTSHLDLYAQEALETALSQYRGAILMVCHDFYTIAGVADKVLYVRDGMVNLLAARTFRKKMYEGTFEASELEKENRKRQLEQRIQACLEKSKTEEARNLLQELSENME